MLLTFFSRAGENYGVDDTKVGNTEVIAGYIKDYFGDKIDVFKLELVNPIRIIIKNVLKLPSVKKPKTRGQHSKAR